MDPPVKNFWINAWLWYCLLCHNLRCYCISLHTVFWFFTITGGSVSSISGSDSDSETDNALPLRLPRPLQLQQQDDALSSCDSEGEIGGVSEGDTNAVLDDSARKYPKIFFRNSEGLLVSVYRCVVYHKKVLVAGLRAINCIILSHLSWKLKLVILITCCPSINQSVPL